MIPLLLAFRGLTRAMAAVWRDPETKALPVVAGAPGRHGHALLLAFEEGWSIVDALYFSVVTLTTVGYGDIHPTSDGTQIFTIIYILTGLGILVALLGAVAEQYMAQKADRVKLRERVNARQERVCGRGSVVRPRITPSGR